MSVRVSKHAIDRYIERVEVVSREEADRRIRQHLPAFKVADAFGAPLVRDGDGIGYFIKNGWVMTIYSPDMRLGPTQ